MKNTQRKIRAVFPNIWTRIGVAIFAVAALIVGTVTTTAGGADAPARRTGTAPQSDASGGDQAIGQRKNAPKPDNRTPGKIKPDNRKPDNSKTDNKQSGSTQSGSSRANSASAAGMACGAAFKPESGGESYQDALAREDKLLGGLDVARVYYTGAPKQWPGKLDTNGRPMIVSFKLQPKDVLAGKHDAHLKQWFAGAPTDRDTYWVYYHEPEDNIEKGEFTAADYRAAWKHIAGLADQAGNERLLATLTLMGYSVEPSSNRNWRDYYPGRDVIDVLAWDIYNYVNEGDGGYRDPAKLFGKAVEVTRSEDLPFAVAETGSAIAGNDDGSGRAQWLRDTLNYLKDQKAVFVSYFDMYIEANHGKQHYELRDSASQAAFKEVCGS